MSVAPGKPRPKAPVGKEGQPGLVAVAVSEPLGDAFGGRRKAGSTASPPCQPFPPHSPGQAAPKPPWAAEHTPRPPPPLPPAAAAGRARWAAGAGPGRCSCSCRCCCRCCRRGRRAGRCLPPRTPSSPSCCPPGAASASSRRRRPTARWSSSTSSCGAPPRPDRVLGGPLQIIGGAGLDVDFSLESPAGELLVEEYRRSDGLHTIEPTEMGDYKLCFDNSFSTLSEKLVFFELIFDSPQEDEDLAGWAEMAEPEETLDIKMEDIKGSIETVKSRLERSLQMQALLRAFEARDRNLQESNLSRVTFWSAVNLSVLLVVSFLQVSLLKSLFENKRRVWM
ncbi:transmembrane emp24 domain-containing protein 1 isoform X1 [Paroedura picta]|uniref:transmembrane emp24 domain-containing protein 1 isoform X1 n=2 Tax=Paroedura picta TaxID=143630 RepID=UPI00405615D7